MSKLFTCTAYSVQSTCTVQCILNVVNTPVQDDPLKLNAFEKLIRCKSDSFTACNSTRCSPCCHWPFYSTYSRGCPAKLYRYCDDHANNKIFKHAYSVHRVQHAVMLYCTVQYNDRSLTTVESNSIIIWNQFKIPNFRKFSIII